MMLNKLKKKLIDPPEMILVYSITIAVIVFVIGMGLIP